MSNIRILFSMPTKHHVEIALDEMTGLQDEGYTCSSFPYAAKQGFNSSLLRLFVIIKNALNLVKIAYRFKPDVIYFNSRLEVLAGTRDFLTILIFKTLYSKKVKFLIKSHGSDLDVIANQRFFISLIVLPYLKRNISGWLFLSQEEKAELIKINYFPAERIFITKNIVRTDQFKTDPDFRTRLNISSDHTILLFVGRIIIEKGINEVIDAFYEIRKQHKSTLIIVGDGNAYISVKERIQTLGISDDVRLIGFIPEQDVVNYYASSDMLVFPTFFPEGFPMALFNSVAAGLCIVTTPIRAAKDFLTEPDNCLWVEPQKSDSVVLALHTLLSSQALMYNMKKNNTGKASLFGKRQIAKELAIIIESIMQQ